MRLRHKMWADDYIENNEKIYTKNKEIGSMQKKTNEFSIVEMEIGAGKGKFIIEKAKYNPNILFIAVERYPSVIVVAAKKVENEKLNNLIYFQGDILELEKYEFLKNKIDKIYLNFSDPWPKKRHTKRRLTSNTFLKFYNIILTKKGSIEQKTDNDKLFQYSIENIANNEKWFFDKVILDLHKNNEDIVTTEYEEKFKKEGTKIKFLRIYKRK